MGADMMVAIAAAPRFTAAAQRELSRLTVDAERVKQYDTWVTVMAEVAIERMRGNDLDADDFEWHEDYLYDDPDHIYPQAQLHAWAAESIRRLFRNQRQVSTIDIGGRSWWITGGLSWGDIPTDAWNPIEMLYRYNLFELRVTVPEIRAAIRKIEGPQPVIEE
jgi:hypothetical protein